MWAKLSSTLTKFEFILDIILILLTFPFIFAACFFDFDLSEIWSNVLLSDWNYLVVLYLFKSYIHIIVWMFDESFLVARYKHYFLCFLKEVANEIKDFLKSLITRQRWLNLWLSLVNEFDMYLDALYYHALKLAKLSFSADYKPRIARWYFLNPYPKFVVFFSSDTHHMWAFLYSFLKTCLLSLIIGFCTFLYFIYFFQLQVVKQLAIWFVILNLFFWLISGFNFFLKRYRYGKFTSAIQRFWKRTNMCFWLVEGFLFTLFFYYFLNSSQEPLYMYDTSSLNQEYLLQLPNAYINLVLLAIVVFLLNYVMLSLVSLTFSQVLYFLALVSCVVFYSFFLESYQFYYVLGTFSDSSWVFSEEEGVWELEGDSIRLRTKQYYFLMCLIAKYWHFIFIFLSWVFFILKTFESRRVTYNLLAFNLQNIIILYVLNLLCYVQWVKWVWRRFLDVPYQWFFLEPDNTYHNLFFVEVMNFFCAIFTHNQFAYEISLTSFLSSAIYLPDMLYLFSIN